MSSDSFIPDESIDSVEVTAPAESHQGLDGAERVNDNDLPPQSDDDILPIVGLGGSAGSIRALQDFFESVSPDLGVAFVVVIHLSPEYESSLPQIIQARTQMKVTQVTDTVTVKPNHVYVIPPAYHLSMRDSQIYLSEPEQRSGTRVAVDLFFRTLAASNRSKAIAVVLSGTDGDGAIGIKRIKEQGGVSVAQDPNEAEFDGMPRTAIDTGMVDWILPVAQIADKIAEWIDNKHLIFLPEPEKLEAPSPEEADVLALREILKFLQSRTGHDFTHYKNASVLRRIGRRLQVNSLENLPQYASYLRTHPGEAGALLQDLLISVTNFFRDPEAFWSLDAHIAQLFRGKSANDSIRVWVAGCATGEEAYSIAILLLEYVERQGFKPPIQIFASDLDEHALQIAREGLYPATIIADVSPERLRRFFVPELGRYRIKKEVRELVLFASHNVLRDAPFSRLDLVSCRNLMIYFKREAQERVLETFDFALQVGGLLFLGGSETAENTHFKIRDKKHCLYEKQAAARSYFPVAPLAHLPLPRPREFPRLRLAGGMPHLTTIPQSKEVLSATELHNQLIAQTAPPSILVNRDYEMLNLANNAGRYVQYTEGEVSNNLLLTVHPALRFELRTAIFSALQNGAEIEVPPMIVEINGEQRKLGAKVFPHQSSSLETRDFAMVIFNEFPVGQDEQRQTVTIPSDETVIHLESEIQHLRSYLRATIEEHEIAGEELKAYNEELQAINEEQRSAAEEIETSREEIQAANEELVTVNTEFKLKIEELGRTNSDLQNLMSSTDIATVFLDRLLHIKRYTPRAQDLFRLVPSDKGRPLADLKHGFENENFIQDAQEVLRTLSSLERELHTRDGQWFLSRISPYRTVDDHIDGVVLAFIDVTQHKGTENALRESSERFQTLFDSMSEAFVIKEAIFDDNGRAVDYRFIDSNPAFSKQTGLSDPRGHTVCELMPDIESLWLENYEQVLKTGEPTRFEAYIGPLSRWLSVSASRIGDFNSKRVAIVFTDITERKQAEEKIRESQDQLAKELADTKQLQKISSQLIHEDDTEELFEQILSAAIGLMKSDIGSLQVMDTERNELHLLAWKGFDPASAQFWEWVSIDSTSACGLALKSGQRVIVADVESDDSMVTSTDLEFYRLSGIKAIQTTPLISRSGRTVGMISTHWRQTHEISEREFGLFDVLARQTADLLERKTSADALRTSEEKYRGLFDSVDVGVCIIEVLFDENQKPYDYLFLEANPAFVKHTGLKEAVGKTMLTLAPNHEQIWFDTYGEIALTGQSARFENKAEALGYFYDVFAFRIGKPDERRVAVLFNDITERRRRESNLEFLTEIAEDLSHLSTVQEIIQAIGSKLGIYLKLSGCHFIEIEELVDRATVLEGWRLPEIPAIAGTYSASRFFPINTYRLLHAGEVVVVGDIENELHADVQRYKSAAIAAFVTVPFHHLNEWRYLLSVTTSQPREWRQDEIDLICEVANRVFPRLERARAEAALRESKAHLQTITDVVPDLLWSNDATGNADWYNQQWLEYTGQTLEEANDFGWLNVVHPDDREVSLQNFKNAVSTGVVMRQEYRIRRYDGKYRWFLVQAQPLTDDKGVIQRWYGAATDIHEEQVYLEALRKSEERFRVSITTFSEAIYIMNADWSEMNTLKGANFLEATENPSQSWIEKYIFIEDRPQVLARIEEAIQSKSTFELEHRVIRADGTIGWTSSRATPLLSEQDQLLEWFGIATDITARKQAEAALQRAYDELEQRVQERTTELSRTLAQLSEEIVHRQKAEEGRDLLLRQIVHTQEEERRRLSRELHDNMGQHLTAILMTVQNIEAQDHNLGFEERRAITSDLKHLHAMVEELINISHRLAWDIRPAILDNVGLKAALKQYTSQWSRKWQIKTGFASSSENEITGISPDAQTALFRVAQEALTNIQRHAAASQVSVIINQNLQSVLLVIEDNGQGTDLDTNDYSGRLGLMGMRERMELVNGTFSFESNQESGFTIYAEVPLSVQSIQVEGD